MVYNSLNRKNLFRWLFNFDTIVIILIVIFTIYFIITSKKKKYDFKALDALSIKRSSALRVKRRREYKKSESKCRSIFESIFNKRFKTIRPDWLKNPATGKNLEIDGFNPDIITPLGRGLGFEYDGIQHSKYTKHFHKKGEREFVYQTKKDTWKDLKCKQQRIVLIRIPHYITHNDMERYIKLRLKQEGVKFRETNPTTSSMYD